jgi:hypothetical protein
MIKNRVRQKSARNSIMFKYILLLVLAITLSASAAGNSRNLAQTMSKYNNINFKIAQHTAAANFLDDGNPFGDNSFKNTNYIIIDDDDMSSGFFDQRPAPVRSEN